MTSLLHSLSTVSIRLSGGSSRVVANATASGSAARAYFSHHILHNWPDCKVKEFLKNTVAAMTPNYSKLILAEHILPATTCPRAPSWADISMMTNFSACERSENQWRELLGSVGLQEVTFWLPPDSIVGVIEAVLRDVQAK